MFDSDGPPVPHPVVVDLALSPLDLTIAPNGNSVVASEAPFGAPDAHVTVREYVVLLE